MVYSVTASNGNNYDLPIKNLGTIEKLNAVLKVDSTELNIKQKYQKLLDFVVDMLGEANVKEILGGAKLADIDFGELEVLILRIKTAYNKPVEDYQKEQLETSFDAIPTDKIVALTKAAETVAKK